MPYSLCYLILNVQIFCYFNHIYLFWHCPQSVFSVSVLNMFKFDILLGCAFTFLSDMADCVAYCDILLYLYAYYIVSLCIILLKFSKNIIYVYMYEIRNVYILNHLIVQTAPSVNVRKAECENIKHFVLYEYFRYKL